MKKSFGTPVLLWWIILLGLMLRLWNINQSFWWDELWSTLPYAGAGSIWKTVSGLGYYFNNHVLYSILCRVSLVLFGESEFTARLPALLLGLAGIYALYHAGALLLNAEAGLAAALLLAVSAFHIDHATEARGYSALMLFSLLSSFFFLRALGKNTRALWLWYGIATFLAFYAHVFMIAAVGSQCLCALLLAVSGRLRDRCNVQRAALHAFLVVAGSTGAAVCIAYAPLLGPFFINLQKVRLVSVDRLPFLQSLLNSLLPGFFIKPAGLLYCVLFLCGAGALAASDLLVLLFTGILLTVPLSLYLASNPMFVFERYFIFLLPFVLLTVGAGMAHVARRAGPSAAGRAAVLMLLLALLTAPALPSLKQALTVDRQNYRDAAGYVTREIYARQEQAAVMSLGYAGRHFQYYMRLPLILPKTFAEFSAALERNARVWCLITAWLPDLRPPHEDVRMYSEDPEQERIHEYIIDRFTLVKVFPAKMPAYLYCSAPLPPPVSR